MRKTYRYRKHLTFFAQIIPFFIAACIVLLIISLAYFGIEHFLNFFLLLIIGELFFIGSFYKKFTSVKLVITDEGVEFTNNKKDYKFNFSEITAIYTAKVGNLGGYFTIVTSSDERVRITVALANISDFIKTLKEKLLEEGMDELANTPKLFSFYKTSLYSDQSFKRISYLWPKGFMALLIAFSLSITDTIFFNDILMNAFLPSTIIVFILFLILEIGIYSKRLKNKINEITWDFIEEDQDKVKKNYSRLTYIFIITYVILAFLAYLI